MRCEHLVQTQWDFSVHREFPIHESLKLQFRAEMFNVLNHPNFGPPLGNLGGPGALTPQFGQSFQMLGASLAGGESRIGSIRSALSTRRPPVHSACAETFLLSGNGSLQGTAPAVPIRCP